MKVAMIFVHGTKIQIVPAKFHTQAIAKPWYDRRGRLWRALITANPDQLTGPFAFEWSGGNSSHAREVAALGLRTFLTNLSMSHDAFCIVAHSHGGNVVLRAVSGLAPNVHKCVKGICCLATPFLSARPRPLGDLPSSLLVAIHGVGSALSIIPILLLLYTIANPRMASTEQASLITIAAIVGVLFWVWFSASISLRGRRIRDFISAYIAKVVEQEALRLSCIPPNHTRFLVVRKNGDEASGFLVASSFLSWFTTALLQALFSCVASPVPQAALDMARHLRTRLHIGLSDGTSSASWY
jgi:hypothetical protein